MLAPVGVQEIVHPEAEIAVAKAARETGVGMILSTLSSNPLESVAEALGNTPKWFQLYWPKDDSVTVSLVQRAEKAGYSAIVVTLDTRLMGWRAHDLQAAYLPFLEGKGIANYLSDPAFRAGLDETPQENPQAAVGRWAEIYSGHSHTWENLKLIRGATSLPILVKGLLHPGDVPLALEAGVQGIIVSNHGGRQIGGCIGAIDALPVVVEAVGGRVPVLFDSGVRNGSDVIVARALGADAVLLGRPYVWGLAVGGAEGVTQVIRRFLADYDLHMALAGFTKPADVTADAIREM
jgi:isopentenyl diphosphate isomerase/L-lactate dehydrogenase-like FMN-dependent dehydrogenase